MTEIQRAASPPRDNLCRMSTFALRAEADRAGDGLTLDGYGAVFNRETIIDSWEGRFKETIAPGAMKKSFRENPPRIQFDHGTHPLIGSIPIAAPEPGYPREEADPELAPDGGAHIRARLHDNWLVQPVRDAIASRSVTGMSFRFSVIQEQWQTPDGKRVTDDNELQGLLRETWVRDVPDDELLLRTLKELRVPELGPVVWPAYDETSVGVRAVTIDLGRLADPAEKNKLARLVLMADRAEAPPATTQADGHATPRDTPPITTPVAETHESSARRLERAAALERVRHTLSTLEGDRHE